MKRILIAACMLTVAFTACEKESLKPQQQNSRATEAASGTNSPSTKMAGKNKKLEPCKIRDDKGKFIARGSECTGKGTQCEFTTGCIATSISGGDDIVFEDLTLDEFVVMWNTDEGREYLESKGCYSKIDE